LSRIQFALLYLAILPLFSSAQGLSFNADADNLGPNVNSRYTDVSPIISPDGKTLYINRMNHPENTGGTEDDGEIWKSTLLEDGSWSEAKPLGWPLNNKNSNFIKGITPDGNSLLLANVYNRDDTPEAGCSMSYRTKDGWSFPKKQNIDKYENRSDYVSYFLSNDGNWLFMSIQMRVGHGKRDLFVSKRMSANNWSRPVDLGPTINTSSDDSSPFLAADGETFYFSSVGHKGYGGADIWMTKRLDDSWTKWAPLVNMGPKINSPGWDSYFTIPASGDYAYFVSSRSGEGQEDIFRIKLPELAKPDPVALISGQVLNSKTNKPVSARITYESLPEGKELGVARSEPVNGDYKIVLPFGKKYGFSAKAKGYYAVSEFVDLTEMKEYGELNKNLYLAPIEVNQIVRLNNIFFESGKSVLKIASFPELNRVVIFLKGNPTITVEISGHTDHEGSDEYNLTLSQERAQAVVDYLISKGQNPGRFTAVGYGETRPVASNDSDRGKQLNRRVEFKILKR